MWASPEVDMPKKDGFLRMRIDSQYLNDETELDTYSLPSMDNWISLLGDTETLITREDNWCS